MDEQEVKILKGYIKNVAETVGRELGSGLSLGLYLNAFLYELTLKEIPYQLNKKVTVFYKDVRIGEEEIQIVVYDTIMVELKSVKTQSVVKDAEAKLKTMIERTEYTQFVVINFEHPSEKLQGNVKIIMGGKIKKEETS